MVRSFVLAFALLAAAATRADPVAEAAKSYRIDTSGSSAALKVGARGKLVVAIVPAEKVHVHPQAPLRLALEPSKGLSFAKAQLGHPDAVDPKAAGPRFEIPFTAVAAGRHEARAKLDFFVCSDQWCVKQTRAVIVPVDVK